MLLARRRRTPEFEELNRRDGLIMYAVRIAQNKRRKGSNWSSSADKTCLPALHKSNPENLRAAFEEECCICNLSLKRKRLNKSKDYPFELENTAKTGFFSMESISEREFQKIYTALRKPTCGK